MHALMLQKLFASEKSTVKMTLSEFIFHEILQTTVTVNIQ